MNRATTVSNRNNVRHEHIGTKIGNVFKRKLMSFKQTERTKILETFTEATMDVKKVNQPETNFVRDRIAICFL